VMIPKWSRTLSRAARTRCITLSRVTISSWGSPRVAEPPRRGSPEGRSPLWHEVARCDRARPPAGGRCGGAACDGVLSEMERGAALRAVAGGGELFPARLAHRREARFLAEHRRHEALLCRGAV